MVYDKSRSGGRHTKLPEEIAFLIQNELLLESKQGWSTKQVNDIIIVRKGGVRYHYISYIIISYIIIYDYTHICRLLHRWSLKQKVPRKIHINTASEKEKNAFKKTVRKS